MVARIVWADQFASHGAVLLRHTCTIRKRGVVTGYDPEGEPLYDDPTDTTGVRCFYWQTPATGEVIEPGREVVGHRYRLRVARDAVVAENDQIADVRNERGVLLQAGPLEITEVVPRLGQQYLLCSQTTTGDTAP